MNKINGEYYYSYCSNFQVPDEKVDELDRLLFFTKANAVRGQRSVSPPDSTGVDETMLFFTTNYKEVFVIGQRKKLLKYLQRTSLETYRALIKELKLRK